MKEESGEGDCDGCGEVHGTRVEKLQATVRVLPHDYRFADTPRVSAKQGANSASLNIEFLTSLDEDFFLAMNSIEYIRHGDVN